MTEIRLRRGTTTAWSTANPILADGEAGWDSSAQKFKVGDGVTAWASLPYMGDAALATKAPLSNPTFTGTVNGITKAMVGLGNVDNTSDANKPISSATQTALNGKAASSHSHSATDITAGTLPDARLATRLGTVAATITDWNSATTNGWYMGNNATNAPTSGTNIWYLGFVEAHNTLYMTQTVHQFTSDSNTDTMTYRRAMNNGTWSAWDKLMLSQTEQDARYLLASAKAAANGVASLGADGKVPSGQLPAAQLGTSLTGTYTARPAASSTAAGTLYYATDTMESYRCNGTAWAVISAGQELGSAELRSTFQSTGGGGVWVDLPGMAVTFIAGERPLRAELTLDFCVTVGNTNAQARILINNTVSMTEISAWQPYSYKWDTRTAKVRWDGLVVGNPHTIKVQVKADTGAEIWVDGSSTKTSLLTVSGV